MANSEGFLSEVATPLESCNGYVILTSEDYTYLTDYTSLTGAEVVEYWSFGFALVFFGYILAAPIKAALKAVRLL